MTVDHGWRLVNAPACFVLLLPLLASGLLVAELDPSNAGAQRDLNVSLRHMR